MQMEIVWFLPYIEGKVVEMHAINFFFTSFSYL